jgi:hypothetical protein
MDVDSNPPPGWPSSRAWLIGCPAARRGPSPFLALKDLPGGKAVLDLLVEGGDLEVEFEVIGRQMWQFNAWDEYKGLWLKPCGRPWRPDQSRSRRERAPRAPQWWTERRRGGNPSRQIATASMFRSRGPSLPGQRCSRA